MGKRSYSDEEKVQTLLALDANGGNVNRTAREAGIPEATVRLWQANRQTGASQPWVAEICAGKRAPLAERLEALAHQLIDAMPEKVGAASLREVAIATGIALEKMQLLRGEPTSVVKSDGPTDEQRAERVAELLDRARARGAGLPPVSSVH